MLECRTQGDAHVIKVTVPQLNSTVAGPFRTGVLEAVKDGAGPVVLDLASVEFVDSSGVGAMVAILKALDKGRTMVLSGPQAPVQSLLELTRMDKIFRVYDSEDAALGSFSATP